MAYLLNGQSININKPYTTPSGVKYPYLKDAALRQQLGVVEAQPEPEFNPQFYLDANTPRPCKTSKTTGREVLRALQTRIFGTQIGWWFARLREAWTFRKTLQMKEPQSWLKQTA
jgi:hypothetical protein